ncbi:hypothetical protein M0802_006712 [Mischocyttarus mexicanus]|nr:hypothetical protein M0802_006712 [Mischocyttarus mexicanus]
MGFEKRQGRGNNGWKGRSPARSKKKKDEEQKEEEMEEENKEEEKDVKVCARGKEDACWVLSIKTNSANEVYKVKHDQLSQNLYNYTTTTATTTRRKISIKF